MPSEPAKRRHLSTTATCFPPQTEAKSAARGKRQHVRTPSMRRDPVWDAFDSDDELIEPEPEYGDLWGEPDEEAE